MLLGDVMNQLAKLELKNLSLVENGVITDAARGGVILAINQGLEDLYSRFNFREKTLLLEIQDGLTEYKLLSQYAWSRRDEDTSIPHFIMDSEEEPYTGDIVRILWAYDSSGSNIVLNDVSALRGAFTPHPDTLLVTDTIQDEVVSVVYQSLPDVIGEDAENTLSFDLPRTMGPALRAFAASKLFESMGTQETIAKSQVLLNAYEEYCLKAQLGDTLNTGVIGSFHKFDQRGFA